MSTVVISIRIRKEIKDELEKYGINIDEELKKYIEELYLRVKAKEYVEKWNKLLEEVKPSEEGFSVRSVREDREGH